MQDPKITPRVTASGLASFAIPRAAIDALIDAHIEGYALDLFLPPVPYTGILKQVLT